MRLSRIHSGPVLEFYTPDFTTELKLPFAGSPVSAGFPSPAEDYIEMALDLNKELIRHPEATFYARVKGHSMIDAGIADGDLLVIDKALEPKDGDIAVCFIDGEFTLKRLALKEDGIYLMPANAEFKPIRITGREPVKWDHLVVEKMIKINQGGYTHENQALQYRTDHQHPERSRFGYARQGSLPQTRCQRCDDLQLEIEIRQHVGQ